MGFLDDMEKVKKYEEEKKAKEAELVKLAEEAEKAKANKEDDKDKADKADKGADPGKGAQPQNLTADDVKSIVNSSLEELTEKLKNDILDGMKASKLDASGDDGTGNKGDENNQNGGN